LRCQRNDQKSNICRTRLVVEKNGETGIGSYHRKEWRPKKGMVKKPFLFFVGTLEKAGFKLDQWIPDCLAIGLRDYRLGVVAAAMLE
jgi:hypothetical protein